MVSFRLFLLILITLCCREIAGNHEPVFIPQVLVSTGGVVLGFALLIKSFAFFALQRAAKTGRLARAQRQFSGYRRWVEQAWCLLLPVTLLVTGWCRYSNSLELAGVPQFVCLILCFLPTIALIALIEVTAAQVDEIVHEGTDASAGWCEHWRIRIRLGDMASLMTCVTPVVLIAALSDISRFGASWADPKLVAGIATLMMLAIFMWSFPAWLSRWSCAQPLESGILQRSIEQFLEKLNLRGIQPMLIPSRNRWAGAAIVGWFPRSRKLWLGDALLEQLNERETEMVVLHELAHVTQLHFLWRSIPVLWSGGAGCAAWAACQECGVEEVFSQAIGALTACSVLLLAMGAMAKRCELDADRTACDLAHQVTRWAGEQSPAGVLADALYKLLAGMPETAATTWLHPSLADRLQNLKRVESEASIARSLHSL